MKVALSHYDDSDEFYVTKLAEIPAYGQLREKNIESRLFNHLFSDVRLLVSVYPAREKSRWSGIDVEDIRRTWNKINLVVGDSVERAQVWVWNKLFSTSDFCDVHSEPIVGVRL